MTHDGQEGRCYIRLSLNQAQVVCCLHLSFLHHQHQYSSRFVHWHLSRSSGCCWAPFMLQWKVILPINRHHHFVVHASYTAGLILRIRFGLLALYDFSLLHSISIHSSTHSRQIKSRIEQSESWMRGVVEVRTYITWSLRTSIWPSGHKHKAPVCSTFQLNHYFILNKDLTRHFPYAIFRLRDIFLIQILSNNEPSCKNVTG